MTLRYLIVHCYMLVRNACYFARFLTLLPFLTLRRLKAEPVIRPSSRLNRSIIIATTSGINPGIVTFDLLLGLVLRRRGVDVRYMVCRGGLAACQACDAGTCDPETLANRGVPWSLCLACSLPFRLILGALGFKSINFSKGGAESDDDNAATGEAQDRITKEIRGSVSRIVGRNVYGPGDALNPGVRERLEQRLWSAYWYSERQAIDAIDEVGAGSIVAHHGVYVPQAAYFSDEVAARVKTFCWGVGHRNSTVLVTEGDTYHRTIPLEPFCGTWSLDESQKLQLHNYMLEKIKGRGDWKKFSPPSESTQVAIIDPEKKQTCVIYTNVSWDAISHFESAVFDSQELWLLETLRILDKFDVAVVVRIHPGELRGQVKSTSRLASLVEKARLELSSDVKVVEPDDGASSYDLLMEARFCVVYGSKIGLEAASLGVPVITVAKAWHSGKGITHEPKTAEDYEAMLKQAVSGTLPRLSGDTLERAKAYAYHFYFKIWISVDCLLPAKRSAFKVRLLYNLAAVDNDRGLNRIVEKIVEND